MTPFQSDPLSLVLFPLVWCELISFLVGASYKPVLLHIMAMAVALEAEICSLMLE